MKKLLLLFLILPLFINGQGLSVRTFPVYIGFLGTPDNLYKATTFGADYHLDEKRAIATNFTRKNIGMEDNSALVYDFVAGIKNYSEKNYFISYNIRTCIWDENRFTMSSYDEDDIVYHSETNKFSVGPDISFGKRMYFSSYHHFFLDLGISLALGVSFIEDINLEKEESTGVLIKDDTINSTELYISPNMLFQIGFEFYW